MELPRHRVKGLTQFHGFISEYPYRSTFSLHMCHNLGCFEMFFEVFEQILEAIQHCLNAFNSFEVHRELRGGKALGYEHRASLCVRLLACASACERVRTRTRMHEHGTCACMCEHVRARASTREHV